MNIRSLAILGLVAASAAGTALADPHYGRGGYGRVVAVEPIIDYVVVDRPREVCRDDIAYRSARPGRVAASTAAGGLIGGAIGQGIGNNIGDTGARVTLGLLGAAAGSAIAHDRAVRRNGSVAVPVTRCEVGYRPITREVIRGYHVTYRYRGRLHRIVSDVHPGSRVRIAHVASRPIHHRRLARRW